MKNKVSRHHLEFIENQLKETVFFISKWNRLLLNVKIQKHGHMSAYLDFLLERYSYRVYNGIDPTYSICREDKLFLKCEVYEATLVELMELARYASLSKGNMFRLLLTWDIIPPKPCSRMVA